METQGDHANSRQKCSVDEMWMGLPAHDCAAAMPRAILRNDHIV